MKLLAVDTSSDACSVAIQSGDDVIEQHVIEPRAHTRILLPMIRQLLAEAGLELTDLDALVLGNGPGSFIGMRIGASVAQGICHGAGLQIVPVSSLAAIAAEVMYNRGVTDVLVAQDARMHEVYVGRFCKGSDGLPVLRGHEEIVAIGPIPDVSVKSVAAGAAWAKYDELMTAHQDVLVAVSSVTVPRARFLLALGQRDYAAGNMVAPDALQPAYLRLQVANSPQA